MNRSVFAKFLLGISLAFLTPAVTCAGDTLNNNEVEFTATIKDFLQNGDGGGTLFVAVNETELRVIVNPKTEIMDVAGEVPMSALAKEMIVRVTGKFSSSGILASKILIGGPSATPDDSFDVCGHLTDIQATGDSLLVRLLGITVTVDADTKIFRDGVEVPVTLLQIGLKVCVDGSVTGTAWIAEKIDLVSKEKKKDLVRFEGLVMLLVDADTIEVSVMGTAVESQVVHYDKNIRIYGEIEVGVPVAVKGILNSDLSITALEIGVLEALEIKPDERKLKVDQPATFTVKLRETAVSGVEIGLAASGSGAVTGLPAIVTIPAGEKTGEFTVTAEIMGEVTITATLGIHTATATIHIGEFSDDDTERPDKDQYMAFAPSHIKMGWGDTRDVVLLIKPPQKNPPSVYFKLGNAIQKVDYAALGDGAASLRVTITSKPAPSSSGEGGVVSTNVVASLQEDPTDAPLAELLVTIQDKK